MKSPRNYRIYTVVPPLQTVGMSRSDISEIFIVNLNISRNSYKLFYEKAQNIISAILYELSYSASLKSESLYKAVRDAW